MTLPQRKRGRPVGSTLDDTKQLNAIADMIVAHPSMRPTTAIKKLNPAPSDSVIRRLQAKWRVEKQALMASAIRRADERRQQQPVERQRHSATGSGSATEHMSREVSRMMALARQFDFEHLAAASASTSALRAIEESTMMKTILAIESSPAMRAVRAIENDPTIRAVREANRIQQIYRDLGY